MDGEDKVYQGPDGTALRFYYRAVKNNFQSERHGRPIFDTSLMVEVMVPGSRESTPEFECERTFCEEVGLRPDGSRTVEQSEKYAVYRQQIEAFKGETDPTALGGTPLSQWQNIDAGTAATLKAVGIHTIEALAGVADGNLMHLGMGGRVLREQANAFLTSRQFGVPAAAMAAENANLHDLNMQYMAQITVLQDEVKRLTGLLDVTTAGTPVRPTPDVPQFFAPQAETSDTGALSTKAPAKKAPANI